MQVSKPDAEHSAASLAVTEDLVLKLLADGASRPQIAQRLSWSLSTLDRFVAGLRAEAGVETNIQLVVRAVRDGRI